MNLLIDITGWTAMVLILIAYFLITTDKVNSRSFLYQMLNLVGAVFFVVYLTFQKAWPSVALNAIWALIAVFGLYAIRGSKKEDSNVDDSD